MKLKDLRNAVFVVAIFIPVIAFGAGDSTGSYSIDQVIFDGNRRIDSAALKAQLEKSSGAIDNATISKDVKALYNTGFFEQVTASIVTTTGGKRALKFILVEKPLVRKIFIKGNKGIKEDDLTDILKIDGKRFLDKEKLDSLIRNATSYYQKEGYYDASLTSSVVPVGDGQVDVTFNVDEGKRYKIRDITMRGVSSSEASDIIGVMQTIPYKWWSSWLFGTGRLNREMLDNDKNLIRNYFLDHGFVDGAVSDPVIDKKEDGIYIKFDVTEGDKYDIGTVTVAGDLIENSAEKTLDGTKVKQGDTFSASKLRDDSFTITDKYADDGYAFANVVPNTTVDRGRKLVNIDYSVSRGKKVQVNQIKIRGNDKTYDHVIRRELKIDEQETYSRAKVKRSQELLERLGYFEETTISTDPVPGRDDQVDLSVNVREASTGSFTTGIGYSTSDGALFNARVSENNIFGTGRRADINFDLGTQKENLVLSYTDRRLDDSYLSFGADAYKTERDFNDFNRNLLGTSYTLGYPLDEVFGETFRDIAFSTKYEVQQIDISNVNTASAAQLVIDSAGKSVSSGVTPRIVRSTINNPLNPSKGSSQEASVEISGLGGDEDYTLYTLKQQLYHPLFDMGFGDFVFSWRARYDYGKSNNDEPFPLFHRFFLGGINSVRGYRNRSLGPKDSRGNEYGGSKDFVNNLEMIFPIVNSAGLKGIFFYDLGQAFDDHQSVDFGNLRAAYGTGIRWTSPLGPIRIEFGFPVNREDGESKMVTMFSFGAPL